MVDAEEMGVDEMEFQVTSEQFVKKNYFIVCRLICFDVFDNGYSRPRFC